MKPKQYRDLESAALEALAHRTLADPGASAAHVQAAVARLAGGKRDIRSQYTPAEIRALREWYAAVIARRASSGSAPGPDPRAAG